MEQDLFKEIERCNGNLTAAAKALSMSRQGLYNKLSEAELAKVAELRRVATEPLRITESVVNQAAIDPDLVEITMMQQRVSERSATRAVLIGAVAEATRRSKSQVAKLIAQSRALQAAVARRMPKEKSVEKDVLAVSLTKAQWEWLRRQRRGTAAKLLAETKDFPPACSQSADIHHTSFLVPTADRDRLYAEARVQGASHSLIFRAVVEQAMRRG